VWQFFPFYLHGNKTSLCNTKGRDVADGDDFRAQKYTSLKIVVHEATIRTFAEPFSTVVALM
jgi:hypothetical protein